MIHFNTVNENLKSALITLMKSDVFHAFRLVGGTALSLQLGHRYSIDIDLFSDVEYGTIDFRSNMFKRKYWEFIKEDIIEEVKSYIKSKH